MSQHRKSHAREGRGLGNGYNENWRNSPLWDNIGPDAKKKTSDDEQPEEVKEVKTENLDELSERERMRRLMRLAH
ncbi:hypothetical protein VPFG_00358 [Vibrio phage nt-1]|uniref:Uncharacterized protein n=1 Tax=Vibrio phage nt-1 TaxID=115992 RepID=R9TJ10_9CAUD|nr:hypothetical protein VPFG_00358 [Vibrio phage nt-1]AGN30355.1 hypothetical protein VPFG_00358 [Vibrio phage nt-1]